MRHLYRSLCEIISANPRMKEGYGYPEMHYDRITEMVDRRLGQPGLLLCRIDLNFIRVGKDAPSAIVAGKAPDRIGVLFCDPTPNLKAGHLVRCLKGPVNGTFEIRSIPDVAQDFFGFHHIEVSLVEVSQSLNNVFPEKEPQPFIEPL